MIRPEARAALLRWREVLAGLAVALAGLWFATRGGWVLGPFGAAVGLLGLGLAAVGLRRMRFDRGGGAGVVQVIEGQVGYFGPYGGGFLALDDLVEVWRIAGGWRLVDTEGNVLDIAQDATGSAGLYDALAARPGLAAAMAQAGETGTARRIWRAQAGQEPRLTRDR
jgi:hypothetical protein